MIFCHIFKIVEYVLLAITKDQNSIYQDRVKDCLYVKKLTETRLDELSKTWRETNIDDVIIYFVIRILILFTTFTIYFY